MEETGLKNYKAMYGTSGYPVLLSCSHVSDTRDSLALELNFSLVLNATKL